MLKRKKDEQLTALLLADDSDEEAANRSLETENNRHQILNTTPKGWVWKAGISLKIVNLCPLMDRFKWRTKASNNSSVLCINAKSCNKSEASYNLALFSANTHLKVAIVNW